MKIDGQKIEPGDQIVWCTHCGCHKPESHNPKKSPICQCPPEEGNGIYVFTGDLNPE